MTPEYSAPVSKIFQKTRRTFRLTVPLRYWLLCVSAAVLLLVVWAGHRVEAERARAAYVLVPYEGRSADAALLGLIAEVGDAMWKAPRAAVRRELYGGLRHYLAHTPPAGFVAVRERMSRALSVLWRMVEQPEDPQSRTAWEEARSSLLFLQRALEVSRLVEVPSQTSDSGWPWAYTLPSLLLPAFFVFLFYYVRPSRRNTPSGGGTLSPADVAPWVRDTEEGETVPPATSQTPSIPFFPNRSDALPRGGVEPGIVTILRGKRILLVEDGDLTAAAAEWGLRKAEAHVLRVASGEEAVAVGPRYGFDIALVDVNLPGMNGYETGAQLVHIGKDRAVVVLAFTADGTSDVVSACRQVGMAGVLHKPLSLAALGRAVADAPQKLRKAENEEVGHLILPSPQDMAENCPGVTGEDVANNNDMAALPVLNSAHAMEIMALSDVEYSAILETVLDSLWEYREALQRAYGNHAYGELADVAHRLRGEFANVGASRVASCVARLETACRSAATLQSSDEQQPVSQNTADEVRALLEALYDAMCEVYQAGAVRLAKDSGRRCGEREL